MCLTTPLPILNSSPFLPHPLISSATCTKVIDDESDYFSVDTNRWLSSDAREALRTKEDSLREQKYGSRRTKAVTLDIAGRRVLEEDTNIGQLTMLRQVLVHTPGCS